LDTEETTYVDDAIDGLAGLRTQIEGVIHFIGGYKGALQLSKESLRAYLANIQDQIKKSEALLSDGQKDDELGEGLCQGPMM